jgi:phosphoribosylamine--glycine ligase
MKIAILGNGGREHAIAHQISKSPKLNKLYCLPGNAGTKLIAENVELDFYDFEKLGNFVEENKINLVIVGPEKPLVDGVVDFLTNKGIKVFGPNKTSSQLEGSKIFTKKICEKYNIPTAQFGIFNSVKDAHKYLEKAIKPIVVKADGLAAGKGVYICEDTRSAKNAVDEIFNGKFGETNQILIEEFLQGEEMSYFVISDGKTFKKFNTAQDHKRVGEGDTGKNTGGMGAYSPSGLINKELDLKIIEKIVKPTFKAIKDLGVTYKGFLYVGLMIKDNNPYLVEYNVRMGDPECQTILPLLECDLLELINSCCEENLQNQIIEWKNKKSICIVVCSNGYPDTYKKNVEIPNLEKIKIDNNTFVYHAGTQLIDNKIYATGGRVLNFVSISNDLKVSRELVIKEIENLKWKNGFYRKDIGFRIIDK